MNIYEEMNIIISYIDKNILEEIEINDLSKITGLNKNIIKNIFPLLVGYGLKEYIRNRKLTLCVEDIKNNNKIVDVAFKYGYNSSNSFIRAFKNFHGISPGEVRKKNIDLILFNKMHFDESIIEENYLTYKILYNKKITLYGLVKEFNKKDKTQIIESFWEEVKEKYSIFLDVNKRYGFIKHINDSICRYYCCLEKELENFEKIEFEPSNYIIFKTNSFLSNDIAKNIKKIIKDYIKSTNFTYSDKEVIEVYHNNYIELLIPIS